MGVVNGFKIFMDDLWVRFKTHSEDESAHHNKYTDAEAQTLIDTHAEFPAAHHTKTIDASELTTGEINAARIPDSFATDFEVNDAIYVHKSLSDAHHAKTTDASEIISGQFDDARIPAAIARDAEVTNAIATHAGFPAAHHIRYGDEDAVDAIEAEAELDLKLFNSATQPRAWVYNTAAQTISHATATVLTWNTAKYNVGPGSDLLWSVDTNPSRLTVKYPGLYFIRGYARFDPNSAGRRVGHIYLNATTYVIFFEASANSTGYPTVAPSIILELAEDDFIQMSVYQNSGGNLNVGGGSDVTGFMAARLY